MQYVFAAVGAVVGFYVGGGPTGAIYGAELGYTIGSVVAASNTKITTEGPRLSDLKTTLSANGMFIARFYVRAGGIGGNIVDGSQLIPAEQTTTTSGKGGPTTESKTTTYSATFMVMLCQSFGDREVVTIKANGNVIWSRAQSFEAASQLVATQLVRRITVYNGAQDQLPDPALEAIHGVGNVPAYRGRLCVMFDGFELANYSNNIEATMLTFEVVEGQYSNQQSELCRGGILPLLDSSGYWIFNPSDTGPALSNGLGYALADPYGVRVCDTTEQLGSSIADNPGSGLPGVYYLDALDGSGPVRASAFRTSDTPIVRLDVLQPAGYQGCPPATYGIQNLPATGFDGTVISPVAMVWRRVRATHIRYDPFTIYRANSGTYGPGDVVCSGVTQTLVDDGDHAVHFYSPVGLLLGSVVIAGIYGFRDAYPDASDAGRSSGYALAASDGLSVFVYAETTFSASTGAAAGSFVAITIAPNISNEFVLPDLRVCGLTVTSALIYLLTERFDSTSSSYHFDCHVHDTVTGLLVAVWTGPAVYLRNHLVSIFFLDGRLVVLGTDSNGADYLWNWDDTGLLHVEATSLVSATVSRYLDWAGRDQYVNTGTVLSDDHRGLYQVTDVGGIAITANPARPLRAVIAEIAAEKGVVLGPYSFQQLPDSVICNGYVITRQTSPRVAIDFLRDLYRVDCAEDGALIKFVLRGGDAVRTLSLDDLGAMEGDGDPPQAIEWTIADELGLPAAVNFKFCDPENNFEIGTAIARRETTASQTVVTLDATAVLLTGTQAARLAEQALTDQRLAGQTVKFSTLYAHEDLETADPIVVPGNFKNRRVRIDSKTDRGGLIEWTGVRDDPASLTQFVVGGGVANSGTGSNMTFAPVTRVDILDLPLLRNADDDAGFYVFPYPTRSSGWRGADIYDTTSIIPAKIGTVSGGQPVRGFTTAALNNYAGIASFDPASSVDVQFPAGTVLESVTRAAIFAGRNVFLIGAEICGVLQTTALGGNLWRLHGGMLRGMRGTEAAIGGHAGDETVYLLSSTSLIRDRDTTAAGNAQTAVSVGAVTTGRGLGDLVKYQASGINTGRALQTFAPTHLAYGSDGVGGLVFRWTRRTHLLFDFGQAAPLGEDEEQYRIDFAATADFTTGVSFFSSVPTLALTLQQLMTLPAAFVWRVEQLASGQGSVALTRPVLTTAPAGVMPADTLPNLLLSVDPSTVADGGPLVDASPTPSTIVQQALVNGGRLQFRDADTQIQITDAAKFNFGSKDFSISLDLILSSRVTSTETFDGGGQVFNHGPPQGIVPGALQMFFNLSPLPSGRGQTPDSGTLYVYATDFGSAYGDQVCQSQPNMNDGVRRVVRVARSAGVFYLAVDGVLVSSKVTAGPMSDPGAVPFKVGGFRGSMGKFTIKTS